MVRITGLVLLFSLTSCTHAAASDDILAEYAGYKRAHFPQIRDLTPKQTREATATGQAVLVDVRTAKEQSISTIPGAITKAEFEQDPERYRDQQVIAYCTIGYRSGLYTKELSQRGFNAYNLAGSVLAWAQAGYLFTHAGRATKKVHVYGRDWDKLPPGYEGVYGQP